MRRPRSRFPRCGLILAIGLLLAGPASAAAPRDFSGIGGPLAWARLKTESPTWDRHARADPRLLEFMRTNTGLHIDTRWHWANVENLDQMCQYPFLFSEGLHHVSDLQGLANLREYLKRGGFIFVDSCINTHVNPDPDAFLEMQIETLKRLLPDAQVDELKPDDKIYSICFVMNDGLPHTYMDNIYNPDWAKHGLYTVHSGGRLVSMISLSGLQCGWDGMKPDPEHIRECMKMMFNIYAYVITH
jgi:hypothetical protein